MPTAPVDEHGNVLFYEDSGVPHDQSNSETPYTTLIIVHGTAFHGVIFHRMMPLASQYNLRLILVNRRDYPGSSPYSDEDLTNISNTEDDKGYEAFFVARAFEFAKFTEWIITHETIPKADWKEKTGGVFLLGWSAGNGFTLPILSYADRLPESTRTILEPYFRGLIVFDAPGWIHGLPPPAVPTVEQSSKDEVISPEKRARISSKWVGSFFKHTSFTSYDITDLEMMPAHGSRRSTTEAMGEEEFVKCTDYNAVIRSEIGSRTGPMSGYAERTRLAAYDGGLARIWPRCGVHVIFCEYSPGIMVETAWTFEKLQETCAKQGVQGRKLRVEMMSGANHFPHWEEPEMTTAFFAKVMAS